MRLKNFSFVYPVRQKTAPGLQDVRDMYPIASLQIDGKGSVIHRPSNGNAYPRVIFKISRVCLEGKDITSFLPALDDQQAIENACRQHLIAAWKRKLSPKACGPKIIPLQRKVQ